MLQSQIWLTASSYIVKYLRISSYIRRPFLIYDFATDPIWISLYKKKISFSFISVIKTFSHYDSCQVEALRTRKKLEADVADLETALEHANAANMESQKTIKKLQLSLREVQVTQEQGKKERKRGSRLSSE